jgi:hypothetical protein
LKPDEITFAAPQEMFERMIRRWRDSFLTKEAWKTVRKIPGPPASNLNLAILTIP